jgi:hypothetical protein
MAGPSVVVPLAGPDFVSGRGEIKGLTPSPRDGGPLLFSTLSRRAWARGLDPSAYRFVLFDRPESRAFAERLAEWFPGSTATFLGRYTRGAAMTCLGGLAAIAETTAPVIVDLADIDFDGGPEDVAAAFSMHDALGGLALTFASDNPHYSYLRQDSAGRVVEAAEKRVISNNASAGVYMFRNPAVLLRAIAHALDTTPEGTHNGLFFVCPLFNGVLAQGLTVDMCRVDNVLDVKQSPGAPAP